MKRSFRPITEFTGEKISFQEKIKIQNRILKVLKEHFFKYFHWKGKYLVHDDLSHVEEGGDDNGSGWYAFFDKKEPVVFCRPDKYHLSVVFNNDSDNIIVHLLVSYDNKKLLAFDVLNESGQLIKVRVDTDDVDEVCEALDSFCENFFH